MARFDVELRNPFSPERMNVIYLMAQNYCINPESRSSHIGILPVYLKCEYLYGHQYIFIFLKT